MNNSDLGTIVLAAGGTGGHIFPAEAVAKALDSRGYKIILITDKLKARFPGVLSDVDTYKINASGLVGKSVFQKILGLKELCFGFFQARGYLNKVCPKAVVGFGGYASFPTILAARAAGYRCAIHEQNVIFGRANRFLSRIVDKVATSFMNSQGVPENLNSKLVYTGMPVRSIFLNARKNPFPLFDPATPIVLLVLGGSQGARILSQVVPKALSLLDNKLKARLKVVQQCREEDLAMVQSIYNAAGISANLASFFENVSIHMSEANLVIARAGASTIAELTVVGCPAILVPYAGIADHHQSLNARAFESTGAGWVLSEEEFTASCLKDHIQLLLGKPSLLKKAAESSRKTGRPDAALRLADLILKLGVTDKKGSRSLV